VSELRRRWSERERKTEERTPFTIEPGSVFVSYASDDRTRSFAKAIADALSKEGMDVWFDQQDLGSGDDFERKITGAIERCAVFVPVISKAVAEPRRFFFSEWRAAIDVSKKAGWTSRFLMPVVVDDIAYNDENVPREFRQLHWERVGAGGPARKWVEDVREEVRKFHKASRAGA